MGFLRPLVSFPHGSFNHFFFLILQDIFQTLGNKRLLEPRKANAPIKKVEKKSPLTLLGHSLPKGHGPDEPGFGADTTGKQIVEKFRSDVKGLRNAIRKSRKSNSRLLRTHEF